MGHDGIKQTLAKLEENNLIRIDNLLKAKLEKEIYQTKRELINVCPGFAIHYSIPFAKASDLDRKKLLAEEIKKLFKRPLVLLGMQATFLQD